MTDDKKQLQIARKKLALDAVNNVRSSIEDFRGDLALKALDVVEHQIQHWEVEGDK